MAMRWIFWGFWRNWFLIDPLHYLLSRSDFGFELAEIFVIEKRLPDSASRRLPDSIRLWRRVKIGSGIGLPINKCVGVDSGVDIRWGHSQLWNRVPYTMFFFGFGLRKRADIFAGLPIQCSSFALLTTNNNCYTCMIRNRDRARHLCRYCWHSSVEVS